MTSGPVLIVEDDADTRHMVEEYLSYQGIPVVTAEDGLQGLRALRAHHPSVILLDLSMPVMDGWRFREEQRRIPEGHLATVPVVVVSALPESQRHADTLGAVDVIPKPIDFDRMVEVVRRFRREPGDLS